MSLKSLFKDSQGFIVDSRFKEFVKTRQLEQVSQKLGFCHSSLLKKYKNNTELLELQAIYESGYSLLENKPLFPIYDTYGELISVCARALDDSKPKYFNTVYDKKNHLYGLSESKRLILENNYVIVVEGYIDWLRLYSNNIPAVALLSTSLLPTQFYLLLRYTDRILLCLDADESGKKNTSRIVAEFSDDSDILLTNIPLHSYKDPDDFIKNLGVVEFSRLYSYLIH